MSVTLSNTTPTTHTLPQENISCCSRLIEIISYIALGIFYLMAAWSSAFLFATAFFIGVFNSDEIRIRITEVFKRMSWKWILPTGFILYAIFLPATITMQGVLAGLDLGSRWAQWAKN